jgi:protein TonB
MFTNLIESQSHAREFKRRSSFFLITVAAYAVILFAAGIVSVYAYDAQLEAQTNSLELLNWVPPIIPATAPPPRDVHPVIHRITPSSAPVDRHIDVPIRTEAVASTNDPTKIPPIVGTTASTIPPVTGQFRLGTRNVDPPALPSTLDACVTCTTAPPRVRVEDKAPEPVPPKPPTTQRVPSIVLSSKAISLPQPMYPAIAKQIHLGGSVSIQILVDEQGRVISAQVVSGHPILSAPAKEAAMRARFTPTILNGQPVKIQGVINYNFVMQ